MQINKVKNYVEKVINEKNYDLKEQLPVGLASDLANNLGVPCYDITYIIHHMRKRRGIRVKKHYITKKTSITDIQTHLLEKELFRNAPNKEVGACETIVNALLDELPRGGVGMMIGTPTTFCASDKMNNNMIITDNLEVAIMLKATTRFPLKIVIGNAINPEKAKLKAIHWRSNNSTNNSDIKLDRVDRNSFTRHVTALAKRYSLCKVILMTSGVWSYCKNTQKKYEKYNIDMNYETPSKILTAKYKNLHILAMTTEPNVLGFCVRYLHNGKNEIIK